MWGLTASVRSIRYSPGSKSTNTSLMLAILFALGIALIAPEAGLCKADGYSQQGAFRVKKNAENMLRELETSGRVAFVLEKTVKGKPLYIVMAHDSKDAPAASRKAPEAPAASKPAPEGKTPEPSEASVPSGSPSGYHSSSAHMLRDSGKETMETDSSGRLILKPLSRRMSSTLALSPYAEVRTSPDEGSEVIGKAGELGALWYVKSSGEWHSIWLSDSRYGYVKETEGSLVKADEADSPRVSATGAATVSN